MEDPAIAWFLEGYLHTSAARELQKLRSPAFLNTFTGDDLPQYLSFCKVDGPFLPPNTLPHMSYLAQVANVVGGAPYAREPRPTDLIVVGEQSERGTLYYVLMILDHTLT